MLVAIGPVWFGRARGATGGRSSVSRTSGQGGEGPEAELPGAVGEPLENFPVERDAVGPAALEHHAGQTGRRVCHAVARS